MRIEENPDINSTAIWKSLSSTQAVFYVIVPVDKLDVSKQLAAATGVKAKFASYVVDGDAIKQVVYE